MGNSLGEARRCILLKEDVAGRPGPRVGCMIRPQAGSGEGGLSGWNRRRSPIEVGDLLWS